MPPKKAYTRKNTARGNDKFPDGKKDLSRNREEVYGLKRRKVDNYHVLPGIDSRFDQENTSNSFSVLLVDDDQDFLDQTVYFLKEIFPKITIDSNTVPSSMIGS